MKATKKAFGAVALSAALAMGTAVPAFAANAVDTIANNGSMIDNGTTPVNVMDASTPNVGTDINVKVNIDQIKVAVPIEMTIVAGTNGGTLKCPSAGNMTKAGSTVNMTGYRLENYSSFPISVNSVTAAETKSTDWKLLATDTTTTVAAVGNIGDLFLELKIPATPPAGGAGNAATGVTNTIVNLKTGAAETAGASGAPATPGTNWKVAGAAAEDDPSILSLELSGNGTKLKNVNLAQMTTDDAFKVTYTVAATSL
ncbi:hypothetical protein [Adlercreutzia sp. ZJ154]|uniref:hypothetical protein n=1 Tax=Adlercreutzia sp. ZJ154 TaxID=2709790 RepID=UPI0013E9CF1C|nr:hypothetical protein [Adlercreutzia sp. ZJ154]